MPSAQGLSGMFSGASALNGDITTWDVSNVADMGVLYSNASVFNWDITEWNVSSVVDLDAMFEQAVALNQDLYGWCVLNIPVEPTGFDPAATSWGLPRPVWGTCPIAAAGH